MISSGRNTAVTRKIAELLIPENFMIGELLLIPGRFRWEREEKAANGGMNDRLLAVGKG